ncbi:acetoin dehydrogenase dihydrolipoyllysine-residue acetyltransferase subunit [Aureimonas sp. N4]|uniref:acetoin dehydrogenase dihydrolipoyllysine-residue acetyltransferase subunit n=1 Tax=Aureimonas sp. N4 TaxID=1638165 RepID=UPI0007859B51|nr:acetoin dehydrogenase dihydrolipoyllysine-residue acetyltransferase subunit [Aureimonas sp. N4]
MPTEVILPKVDMDMATGQISRWFYKDGDTIKKGEPLFEIETDKAAMEVDAPASGTLRNVTGAEGVDIAVGSPVAWIYAEGEAVNAPAPTADAGTPNVVGPDPDGKADSKPAERQNVPARMNGGGKPCCGKETGERRGVRATPLARRIARHYGIDLSSITGHGPMGRIGREDVEAAAQQAAARARPAEAPVRTEPPAPAPGLARQPAPQPAPAKPRLVVNGETPLHVVTLREGEGTPLVLLHGFGSESASWRPLLAEFTGPNPVLGLDLAGHGGSVGREADGFDALVSGVEETLQALGLASCHLVGHSLGGAVAAAVAAGLAIDVRSLLLLAPAGFGPDIDTAFAEGFARAREEAPIRSWLRHLVSDPAAISDGFVRATARGRADGVQSEAQTRLVSRLFSNGTQHFDVRGLLADLAMPVKIVAGTEDRVVPVRHFAGLPGRVALHVFPRTGHMPQFEQRAEVARLLRELTR